MGPRGWRDVKKRGKAKKIGLNAVSAGITHSFGLAPENPRKIGCAGSEKEGFYLGRQTGNSGLERFRGGADSMELSGFNRAWHLMPVDTPAPIGGQSEGGGTTG